MAIGKSSSIWNSRDILSNSSLSTLTLRFIIMPLIQWNYTDHPDKFQFRIFLLFSIGLFPNRNRGSCFCSISQYGSNESIGVFGYRFQKFHYSDIASGWDLAIASTYQQGQTLKHTVSRDIQRDDPCASPYIGYRFLFGGTDFPTRPGWSFDIRNFDRFDTEKSETIHPTCHGGCILLGDQHIASIWEMVTLFQYTFC